MFFPSATVRARSTASSTTRATWTFSGAAGISWSWTRDRSMISVTSWVSRVDSFCMRPPNRATASGSSAKSVTASASSDIAPMGVLSSWETFAMKSRLTASTRRDSVWSSHSTRTKAGPSAATRAWR